MPSMTLRRRLVIPLACVLIAYGGFHTYLTVRTQSTEVLSEALRRNEGNVTRAAAEVGMLRPNFQALMRKYEILRPEEPLAEGES